jgi:hypothetical protein
MIYCIWYPSGGFGHFVNSVITLHGVNFARPKNKTIKFSATGDSHAQELVAPRYFQNPKSYNFDFDDQFNYSVLIDNGINNEGRQFLQTFPTAKVIKLCYSDQSWPVVALTMFNKAMRTSVDSELGVSEWNTDTNWARREKYFLFLRDHVLRHQWRHDAQTHNIFIEDLLDYDKFNIELKSTGIKLENFKSLWDQWYTVNFRYFDPVLIAKKIINQINNKESVDLTSVNDQWTQAVVYYFLWLEFKQEVPHNDYADFFENTDQIRQWLKI